MKFCCAKLKHLLESNGGEHWKGSQCFEAMKTEKLKLKAWHVHTQQTSKVQTLQIYHCSVHFVWMESSKNYNGSSPSHVTVSFLVKWIMSSSLLVCLFMKLSFPLFLQFTFFIWIFPAAAESVNTTNKDRFVPSLTILMLSYQTIWKNLSISGSPTKTGI